MKEKEEEILEEIIKFINANYTMPSMRYLQKKLNYKSVNSISRYIKSLENQNYLIRNNENKLILNKYSMSFNNIKPIKIINSSNKSINIFMDKNKKYLGYKIHNSFFDKIGILRNDILIIELKNNLKDNDLGLFIIDKKYRIMKYNYIDGFYILNDNETILLNKVKIVGKVVMIERKL